MYVLSDVHKYPPLLTCKNWRAWLQSNVSQYPEAIPLIAQLRDKKTYLGIEIEVENIREDFGDYDGYFWTCKEDNSLRNHGVEYVSNVLIGDQIVYALLDIARHIPASAIFSHRTSIHIHMNVRDMTPDQIAKFMLSYLVVERLFYLFADCNRDKNIFCVPLYDLTLIEHLFKYIQNFPNYPSPQTENTRYSGLNFDPLSTFGSVEFRQLHGTSDVSRLLIWINFILCLKQFSLTYTLDELIKEIITLNTNSEYKTFALKIFGPLLDQFPQDNLEKELEIGVLSVKRSLFSNDFKNYLEQNYTITSVALQFVQTHFRTKENIKRSQPMEPQERLNPGINIQAIPLADQIIHRGGARWAEDIQIRIPPRNPNLIPVDRR